MSYNGEYVIIDSEIMWNLPNLLSLLRFPLALLFTIEHLGVRIGILALALLSDGLDGYLARRYRLTSQLGALLDPIMDKFFAGCVIGILWREEQLSLGLGITLLSRDIAVGLYGLLLLWQGRLGSYRFHSIWSGKLTTCLQFAVFMAILMGITIPVWIYVSFILLGVSSLTELYLTDEPIRKVL